MKIQSDHESFVRGILNRFFCVSQLSAIPPAFFVVLAGIALTSLILLYSAGGGLSPWCVRQAIRFMIGFTLMFVIAASPIRMWYSYAYWLYGIALSCLLLTTFIGVIGMGAQRWINLFFFQFQPSELMRISMILALARYFNDHSETNRSLMRRILVPTLIVLVPVLLTLEQPDLGTAMLLLLSGGILFFFAGIPILFFVGGFAFAAASMPFFWHFLHDYQKNRILTFLHPERDPLGAGYHILQSKIAIGSGGFWGKGFMHGTQSGLNFLPEKQTDFIFTLLSEEFGFLGVLVLLTLYGALIMSNFIFALKPRNLFCRLTIAGLTASFALYALINIAMVVGFLPVVGIPLPLVSYGGTSIVTILISQGIILSAAFYKLKPYQIDLFRCEKKS